MKFTKEIARPGKYVVNVPRKQADGTVKMVREEKQITKDHIASWESKFLKMREKGLLVPAPFYHDLSALPLTPEERTALELEQRKEENRTKNNAGYWEHMFRDADGKLHGIIDVEVPEYQERMGKSFKECSLLSLPTFVDGNGEEWKDSILHVAVVTNPVQAGQENFKPIESNEGALALSMSMAIEETPVPEVKPTVALVKEDGTAMALGDITAVLPQMGITLPQDTNEANFLDRLLTAITALVATKNANGKQLQDGNGLTIIPGGLAMSHSVDINTPHGKNLAKQQRDKITARITTLLERGVISAPYVKDTLNPLLEGCALSLTLDDEGNLGPTSLDPLLDALERTPAFLAANGKKINGDKAKLNIGAVALALGEDSDEVNIVNDEQADSVRDQIFKNVGYRGAPQPQQIVQ